MRFHYYDAYDEDTWLINNVTLRSVGAFNWTADVGGWSSTSQNPSSVPVTENTTFTLTTTSLTGCQATSNVAVTYYANPVAGTVAVTDLSVSGNADLTEAIEADQITWTNTGTANGSIQYYYEWTDNSGVSPSGAWNPWVTSNPNLWNANSSGSNMNRTLWVKTITTSDNGCGTPQESAATWINVRNCRADDISASVSSGTVSNMPFGGTITYDANYSDGVFERFQYQWQGTDANSWSDWVTSEPLDYTTDINAGQTLYVRSKITGESVSGSPTCTQYSDPVQTFLIDCASTSSYLCTSNEAVQLQRLLV